MLGVAALTREVEAEAALTREAEVTVIAGAGVQGHHQDPYHLPLLRVTSLRAGAPSGAEVYPVLSLL